MMFKKVTVFFSKKLRKWQSEDQVGFEKHLGLHETLKVPSLLLLGFTTFFPRRSEVQCQPDISKYFNLGSEVGYENGKDFLMACQIASRIDIFIDTRAENDGRTAIESIILFQDRGKGAPPIYRINTGFTHDGKGGILGAEHSEKLRNARSQQAQNVSTK
jgi:hypothetical protein